MFRVLSASVRMREIDRTGREARTQRKAAAAHGSVS